jgi:Fe-S-cluster-containing dehydrogenase component
MDQNDIDIESGETSFRNVSAGQDFKYQSTSCRHCENPACIEACVMNCIFKDPETGLTIYDNSLCIGCKSCYEACPFSIPSFNKEEKMEKCDGCATRVKNGLSPACVKICPSGALRLVLISCGD